MEKYTYSDLTFTPSLNRPGAFSQPGAAFWGGTAVDAPSPIDGAELVGDSAAMRRLRLQMKRIGPYFRAALISGEPGVGKGRIAMALHEAAVMDRGAFVTCEVSVLEAAARDNAGAGSGRSLMPFVEAAAGGSLFFDRVEEASPRAQNFLLRWMEQGDRERRNRSESGIGVGTEMRIIASSHEDLKVLSSTGQFRPELYQRLAMIEIGLTPLRERQEDIAPLARHFLRQFAAVYGKKARDLSEEAIDRLVSYHWPGNVRELENVVRGAVLETDGPVVGERHLPVFPQAEPSGGAVKTGSSLRLQDVIDEHVLGVLRRCAGNKLRAAEMLGISRSTLYRMLDAATVAERGDDL